MVKGHSTDPDMQMLGDSDSEIGLPVQSNDFIYCNTLFLNLIQSLITVTRGYLLYAVAGIQVSQICWLKSGYLASEGFSKLGFCECISW